VKHTMKGRLRSISGWPLLLILFAIAGYALAQEAVKGPALQNQAPQNQGPRNQGSPLADPAAQKGPALERAGSPQEPIGLLIRDLGDRSFQVRERASRELEQRGAQAIPALEEAARSKDMEAQSRAEDILERLGRRPGRRSDQEAGREGWPALNGEPGRPRNPEIEAELLHIQAEVDRMLRELERDDQANRFLGGRHGLVDRRGGRAFDLEIGSPVILPPGAVFGPGSAGGRVRLPEESDGKGGGLGVWVGPADRALRAHLKLAEGQGVVVFEVEPSSPAAAAGLEVNDIILSFQGKLLAGPGAGRDLARLTAEAPRGKPIPVDLIRRGERRRLQVVLKETLIMKKTGAPNRQG
jgi:hypothetical protein